jgi:hypothetical protein
MQAYLSTVGMQIERDSIMLASSHREVVNTPAQQQMHGAACMVTSQNLDSHGRGQGTSQHPYTQSVLPVFFVTPALPPTTTPPYQTHALQHSRSAAMWSAFPQHAVPAVRMHAQVPTAQSSNVTWSVSTRSPPLPDCNIDA